MQTIHACNHTTPEALYPFDARGIAKRFRHAAIFGALDALQPGETMRFCNDHDPLPLLAQLQARYGANLSIEYKQRETGAIVIDFTVVG
ncbi:MAG: DUF2249 domain-containing protein [Betaproteobacteria bacterium]|nr:DUF2249 domain-containing protein [Betaproteobacteria bacterium]